MERRLLWMMAVLALAGCKAPAPSIDPFLGRQTVVPPRPGAAVASVPQAYYPAGPATATVTSSGVPSAAPRFVPPPSGSTLSTSPTRATVPVSRPAPATGTASPEPAVLPTGSAATPGGNPKPLRSASPNETPPGGGSGARAVQPMPIDSNTAQSGAGVRLAPQVARQALTVPPPRPFVPATATTDISQWHGAAEGPVVPSVLPASHQPAADDQDWNPVSRNVKASASGLAGAERGRYGFDPDYSRLEGRLEFSQAAQRWKLRYIPLDGQTDDYGGSVVLLDTPLLDAYHAGDFVTLHGQVAGEGADPQAYAPLYRVERIERGQ